MATINAGKYGTLRSDSTSSWSAVRNATTATSTISNQPTQNTGITASITYLTGGKGSEWGLYRAYFAFDVTSYQTGYNITNLELEIDPSNLTSSNFPYAIIKSTAQGNANSDLVAGDWDSLDFSTLYGGGSTTYWPDTNTVSQISLNSNATAAFSTGYLKICIVWYSDYSNTAPISTGNFYARQNFSYVPRINFTATAAGYSNDIIGVDSSNIGSVITVASADIGKIIGV
jgi:hypothetical protein|tara:strand:- start:456 stop:1145 length:690 start_codon:yes stop_codon:yes gene_type:complete